MVTQYFEDMLRFLEQEHTGLSSTTVVGIIIPIVVILVIGFVAFTRWNQKKLQQQYGRNLAPDENFQVRSIRNFNIQDS